MAYATNADMLLEFKGLVYGSTPLLASTTVDAWLIEASNLIDSYLAGRYTVPLTTGTNPNSHSLVKSLCIELVRSRMNRVLKVESGQPKTNQVSGESLVKITMQTLCDIRDGKVVLSDASLATTPDGVESYVSSNLSTTAPQFKRGEDTW